MQLGGVALLAVCTMAAPAAAQNDICGKAFPTPPAGSWVQWQGMTAADSGVTTKMAIIDDEQRNGKTYHRIEMTSSRSPGAMQMVVPGWPPQIQEVDEMVMQRPGQPPMKMSGAMLNGMKNAVPTAKDPMTDFAKLCHRMKILGTESITVPAGTFKTTHMRDDSTGSDVWWTPDVPFGMVKFVGKDIRTQLVGTGKDAKTVIVGTPMEMQMPPMMGKPKN
jgi:hypothetical protein